MADPNTEAATPDHLAAGGIPRDFAEVVIAAADKNKRTFMEQLLSFAVDGAECARMHKNR